MRICAPQGAEEGWSVKKYAIAKTAEGKLGVVTMDPVDAVYFNKVRLRFADGERCDYIEAASLTQATPSDAGYEDLAQMKPRIMAELELCAAARAGDAAAIERLAGEGASPDAKDEQGWPAVCRAAWEAHTAAVEALLRLGADPNATTEDGTTALMYAAVEGQAACARLLLEAGADAALRATGGDWEGKTALEVAEDLKSWNSEETNRGKAKVAALLRREPEPEPEVTRSPPPPHLSAPLARPRSPTSRVAFFKFRPRFLRRTGGKNFARSRAVFRFKLSLVSH
eukprot:COSAG04_NODE_7_length_45988_cov_220.188869_22_plen_284_part_00